MTAGAVVILLHGHDDAPSTFDALASRLRADGLVVHVPTGPFATPNGATWFDSHDDGIPRTDHVLAALDAVDAVVADAEPDDVTLAGFSQGGALGLLWALRAEGSPRRIAGVASIAGWLPSIEGVDLDLGACRARRVLVAHGAEDDVVPLPAGRSVARLLDRHAIPVVFVERDAGHTIAPFVDDITTWLAGA